MRAPELTGRAAAAPGAAAGRGTPRAGYRRALRGLAVALAGTAAALPVAVRAENHGLILWIGNYADVANNLQGIDRDAAMAREIAALMGVPGRNIAELKNQELTHSGMVRALETLLARVRTGDKVFIYFSGHGRQINNPLEANRCSEGLVTHEGRLYFDVRLQQVLQQLAARATQVVMLNDSCHAGGTATKHFVFPQEGYWPKVYRGEIKGGAGGDGTYRCGEAVNKADGANQGQREAPTGSLLYVAGAADTEISYTTAKGSVATQAWWVCMHSLASDRRVQERLSGEAFARCAQQWVNNQSRHPQTISLVGNQQLSMSFAATSAAPSAISALALAGGLH